MEINSCLLGSAVQLCVAIVRILKKGKVLNFPLITTWNTAAANSTHSRKLVPAQEAMVIYCQQQHRVSTHCRLTGRSGETCGKQMKLLVVCSNIHLYHNYQ